MPKLSAADFDEGSVSGDDVMDDIPAQTPSSSKRAKSPASKNGQSDGEEALQSKAQLDDELHDQADANPAKKVGKKAQKTEVPEDESDDNAEGADEYEVEQIVGHKFGRGGVILYKVRWKGWSEADDTWEPTDNLLPESRDILATYHDNIGGQPAPKSKQVSKRKSKSTLTDGTGSESPAPKRRKRQSAGDALPIEDDDPSTVNGAAKDEATFGSWLPKTSRWDDLIEQVETIDRDDKGNLRAYIKFKNGKKTKVARNQYYMHCPTTMLKFYEDHLSM